MFSFGTNAATANNNFFPGNCGYCRLHEHAHTTTHTHISRKNNVVFIFLYKTWMQKNNQKTNKQTNAGKNFNKELNNRVRIFSGLAMKSAKSTGEGRELT